jgi:hypothetical protein
MMGMPMFSKAAREGAGVSTTLALIEITIVQLVLNSSEDQIASNFLGESKQMNSAKKTVASAI